MPSPQLFRDATCMWPNPAMGWQVGVALELFQSAHEAEAYHFSTVMDYRDGPMVWIYYRPLHELPQRIQDQVARGSIKDPEEYLRPIGTVHLVGDAEAGYVVELKVQQQYMLQFRELRQALEGQVGKIHSCMSSNVP